MTANFDDVVVIADKIEALINDPNPARQDDAIRRRLREAGRRLSWAMEAPWDIVHRISNTPLQLAVARIGVETHLFDILSNGNEKAFSLVDLSQETKTDPLLMKRLLRYMQSYGMIDQLNKDQYAANNCTKAMAPLSGSSGINHFFEVVSPTYMALPRFLRENGYQNATDPSNCPWNLGWKTSESLFPWLQSHPEHFSYFLPWMTAQREGLPMYLDQYPFEEHVRDADSDTPVFVDIGGAMGHQCIAVKRRFPEMSGRVILQDQSQVLDQVKLNPPEGVELMTYDFFTPQTVVGARAYYMRNVLHDWPDHTCKEILQNTMKGMTKDSVLLIDEMVLPEVGAPWRATQIDIAMLTCVAGMERSEVEWRQLLDDAGMKVLQICQYTDECQDCIIVAVPK